MCMTAGEKGGGQAGLGASDASSESGRAVILQARKAADRVRLGGRVESGLHTGGQAMVDGARRGLGAAESLEGTEQAGERWRKLLLLEGTGLWEGKVCTARFGFCGRSAAACAVSLHLQGFASQSDHSGSTIYSSTPVHAALLCSILLCTPLHSSRNAARRHDHAPGIRSRSAQWPRRLTHPLDDGPTIRQTLRPTIDPLALLWPAGPGLGRQVGRW